MKVIIFGGTGFIGQSICRYFQSKGLEVYIATRSNQHKNMISSCGSLLSYTFATIYDLFKTVSDNFTTEYAVINLAGESINGRWTEERKGKILSSRLQTTKAINAAIIRSERSPNVLLNASAIGFYGDSESKTFTEHDVPGHGFLATVAREWEHEAYSVQEEVRVVIMRLGMVLGKEGGALPRMQLPYFLFAGGKIGSGKQWISWIHNEDVAGIFYHCLTHQQIEGPVNLTAPYPVTMNEFGKTLAQIIHRPHWLPVPEIALKLLLGEMAELVVKGQRVLPQILQNSGYSFQYPTLKMALTDILLENKS